LPTCRELGIGFVPFSPLGRGFLTGSVPGVGSLPANDMRRGLPRFRPGSIEKNASLVETLAERAAAKGATAAQLSLAWLLTKDAHIVPIPGTKRRTYLEQNVAATDLVLSAGDVADLDGIFSNNAVHGARYPEELMKLLDVAE